MADTCAPVTAVMQEQQQQGDEVRSPFDWLFFLAGPLTLELAGVYQLLLRLLLAAAPAAVVAVDPGLRKLYFY